jgi:hypothetical protein
VHRGIGEKFSEFLGQASDVKVASAPNPIETESALRQFSMQVMMLTKYPNPFLFNDLTLKGESAIEFINHSKDGAVNELADLAAQFLTFVVNGDYDGEQGIVSADDVPLDAKTPSGAPRVNTGQDYGNAVQYEADKTLDPYLYRPINGPVPNHHEVVGLPSTTGLTQGMFDEATAVQRKRKMNEGNGTKDEPINSMEQVIGEGPPGGLVKFDDEFDENGDPISKGKKRSKISRKIVRLVRIPLASILSMHTMGLLEPSSLPELLSTITGFDQSYFTSANPRLNEVNGPEGQKGFFEEQAPDPAAIPAATGFGSSGV